MSNDFKRTDRIAEIILRKLAHIIQQEVTDPRLPKFITISAVKVSKDLSHAKVYFTALNHEPEKTVLILNTAASYLRTILAKTIKLRTVPQLHFVYDESIEYGKRLSRLIDEVNPASDEDE
ncbi:MULTISPECIES: 30S ribosome-binding factor RbfA [Legionella]|uniref:Ribosome-binding factor A n=1 Tax=Legionella septentrionalis TaxID=2498109 RepID=A0A3S0VBD4_9GAMM|nr:MULTISPECIES: 30S ribosome-binding factor RbfA [Legionella]MCP0912844.1 30S ribosome-binding factor RbfA [Legionella sp. 27cVA30]RUQ90014.1 30S ribosome-binding factor RbfA [Legionella septentrionalis]RUQ97809.1 30S ribosome-binding factor RbfA [Legionella septentrionalis]RUR11214.1 30S ribosome-binding factor RbfA [Legionella septentrionalis]RUR16270.1 30S ribosome-binding factor RbfA [Legionella septentrionalis]